ncbi:MAG: toll/interleukin-1 receptor domain-containing protein [Mycobacterium sp.]|uniref:toll/interleukin-1 receptor domain-containing protein n=1 Tax=Mycobacterium sp. TaxID=1785 RepID=UPI003F9E4151
MTTAHRATRKTAWARPASVQTPQLFVSYPRENKREVDELVDHLQQLNYKVWADSSLRGGQEWWDEILRQIADCDALIAIVSGSTLDSVACRREREWALKLNKPVLPVAVERVLEAALPGELSMLQIVDYSTPGVDSAFALAAALSGLGPAPPRPEKWPDPPLAPLSYLSQVVDRVSQDEPLTQEEQRRILDQLQTALGSADPEEQQGGREILDRFSKRADLFADVDRRVGQLLARKDTPSAPGPISGQSPAHPPTPRSPKRAKIISTIVSTLAIIGVISAAFILSHPSRQKPTSSSPADAQARLFSLLPQGYRDSCELDRPPPGSSLADALAFVRCHPSPNSGLPPNAVYALFSDKARLKNAWEKAVANDTMQPCPGGIKSPGTWPLAVSPNLVSGMVACAIYKDPLQSYKEQAEVEWTDESEKLFGAVWKDPDPSGIDQLYEWWDSH